MLTMKIFKDGTLIEEKSYLGYFLIMEDSSHGELFWHTHSMDKSTRHGIFRTWVHPVEGSYQFAYILPEWQLTVDGETLPQEFLQDVDVTGKLISLKYKTYEFVCKFPEIVLTD